MNSKRAKKRAVNTAVVISLKDKILILAIVLIIVCSTAALLLFRSIQQQQQRIDQTLMRWRLKYHLDDQQVAAIRLIELEFHGNGVPFSGKSGRTPEEIRQHHLALSKAMGPEDGARFLMAMEKNQAQH